MTTANEEKVVRDMGELVRGKDGIARAGHAASAVRGYDRDRALLRFYADAVWVRANAGRPNRNDSPGWWSAKIDREFWTPLAAVAEASGLVSAEVRRVVERAEAWNVWDIPDSDIFTGSKPPRGHAADYMRDILSQVMERERKARERASSGDDYRAYGGADWWRAEAEKHLKARRFAEYEAAMRMANMAKSRDARVYPDGSQEANRTHYTYRGYDPVAVHIPTDEELKRAKEKIEREGAEAVASADFGFGVDPGARKPAPPKKYNPATGRAGKQKKDKFPW